MKHQRPIDLTCLCMQGKYTFNRLRSGTPYCEQCGRYFGLSGGREIPKHLDQHKPKANGNEDQD